MPTPKTSSANRESSHGLASLEQALKDFDSRHVSLVVIRIEDLPEMRGIYEPAFYQATLHKIQKALAKIVSGRGIGARTGPTEYTLVLPNMYQRETLALLSAQLGRPARFEIEADGVEAVLVPEIATDMIGQGESIRHAHARLRADLMKTIERERTRLAGMTRYRENIVRRAAKALQFLPSAAGGLRAVSPSAA